MLGNLKRNLKRRHKMEKEVTEVKESVKIQQKFTQLSAQLGSKMFEMHMIEEDMKELNLQFKVAYDKENPKVEVVPEAEAAQIN